MSLARFVSISCTATAKQQEVVATLTEIGAVDS